MDLTPSFSRLDGESQLANVIGKPKHEAEPYHISHHHHSLDRIFMNGKSCCDNSGSSLLAHNGGIHDTCVRPALHQSRSNNELASPIVGTPLNGGGEAKYHLRKRKLKQERIALSVAEKVVMAVREASEHVTHNYDYFNSVSTDIKPKYTHIEVNDYSQIENYQRISNPDPTKPPDSNNRPANNNDDSPPLRNKPSWICDCQVPSSLDDYTSDALFCGPGCINRALNIECGSSCLNGSFCSNRRFHRRIYAPTEPFYSGPAKGWGLRATRLIKKNTFIVEYVGEVVNFLEFSRRIRRYERLGHCHHFFMALESDRFIDAGNKGNWARFVNHSCEPNCATQKWSVNGALCIGFFSLVDIQPMEEVTIDYQFEQYGASQQKCYCGTNSCSGVMGFTNKSLQERVRLKDTSGIERRALQLLQYDSFQTAQQITLLLQVMVQECLTVYARLELLKRLAATKSDACLKLFSQYNGLDMLSAYMRDSDHCDWQLKRQILLCLDVIPVSEQRQVNSDFRLMDIVSQWAVDPSSSYPRSSPPWPTTTTLNGDSSQEVSSTLSFGSSSSSSSLLKSESNVPQYETTTPYQQLPVANLPADRLSNGLPNTTIKQTNDKHVESNSIDGIDHSSTSMTKLDQSLEANNGVCTSTADGSQDQQSSLLLIAEIRQLALALYTKWSKLPPELYRIPRLERQETECLLNLHTGSALSTSFAGKDDADSTPNASGWSSAKSTVTVTSKHSSDSRSSGANRTDSRLDANKHHGTDNVSSRPRTTRPPFRVLTKDERRRLFEEKFATDPFAASCSSSSTETTTPNNNCDALQQPPSTGQTTSCSSSSTTSSSCRPEDSPSQIHVNGSNDDEQDASMTNLQELIRQAAMGMLKQRQEENNSTTTTSSSLDLEKVLEPLLLHHLSRLVARDKTDRSNKPTSLSNECLATATDSDKQQSTSSSQQPLLPPDWASAFDSRGVAYYYHKVTKVVQWERPTEAPNSIPMVQRVLLLSPIIHGHRKQTFIETMNQWFNKDWLRKILFALSQLKIPEVVSATASKKNRQLLSHMIGKMVMRYLRPFRLPNCLTGRIDSDLDFHYLGKKLTHTCLDKDWARDLLTRLNSSPSQSPSSFISSLSNDHVIRDRIKTLVTRYMLSKGSVYHRRPSANNNNSSD